MSPHGHSGRPGWTTPDDLRAQVLRLWQRGLLLVSAVDGESRFPLRLTFKVPTAAELSTRYDEAIGWIADLTHGDGYYRVVLEERRHRQLGTNLFPTQVWLDTREDALAFIRKGKEAEAFDRIVAESRARQPLLLPWLARRPLQALELAAQWSRLLNTVTWLQQHPRPGIYLRQADIPEVDSKFIEQHRRVLAELLELALPAAAVLQEAAGVSAFERRYGFRTKVSRVRFRFLDHRLSVFAPHAIRGAQTGAADDTHADEDLTVPLDLFAALQLPVRRVFIIENEIDFLAFPPIRESMAVFGAGYRVGSLAAATWLRRVEVHYWGDIDTDGFAILDALRSAFPATRSLLMDRQTLLAHRAYWGQEPQSATRDLLHLHADEAGLYDDLRTGQLGERVRLEQERIRVSCLHAALQQAGLQLG